MSRMKMPSETIRSLKMLSGQNVPAVELACIPFVDFLFGSSFIVSLIFFGRELGLAVLDDQKEMHAISPTGCREQPDMGGKESLRVSALTPGRRAGLSG